MLELLLRGRIWIKLKARRFKLKNGMAIILFWVDDFLFAKALTGVPLF